MTTVNPRERVFDTLPSTNPGRERYLFRSIVDTGSVEPVSVYWKQGAVLDQGTWGACVGFGWTAELLASPRPDPYTDSARGSAYAFDVYNEAKKIDEWPGENYNGTSTDAGARVIRSRGLIGSYYWAKSITEVRDALITKGPVVIGLPWYENMFYTRDSGLVTIGGSLVGGHCLTLTGYSPRRLIAGERGYHYNVYRWRNSWGTSYGKGGDGFITEENLAELLFGGEWGEACVPADRSMVRLSS